MHWAVLEKSLDSLFIFPVNLSICGDFSSGTLFVSALESRQIEHILSYMPIFNGEASLNPKSDWGKMFSSTHYDTWRFIVSLRFRGKNVLL